MFNEEQNQNPNLYSYKRDEIHQDTTQPQPAAEQARPSVDDQIRDYQTRYQSSDAGYRTNYQPTQSSGWQGGQTYNYSSAQQPVKQKKSRTGLKIAALALACALLGGAAGAGLTMWLAGGRIGGNTAEVNVSSRPVADVVLQSVDGQKLLSDAENYAANVNSVVSINCSATTNYFGYSVENASSGSGFILSEDGYIVTNCHVIEGATKVTVTLYSGDTYEAAIIGSDEDYDIGVIKIEAKGLKPVTVGDSEKLNVGDRVLAIGNPLGELTFSQSGGMVSSVNRAINVDGTPFNMIQTDASINPGNSGGPMFNSYGEVVGIVTAKYSTYSDSVVEGLGFAIPINDVMSLIEDIMTNGYVTNKPYLGINGGTLTKQMAAQYRYTVTDGLFVYSVEEGSAAAKAGLQMGDVIRKVDDNAITSLEDLTAVKKKYSAGDTVTLTVYRGGSETTMELTWDAQPASEPAEEPTTDPQQPENQYPNQYPGNYGDLFDMFEDFFNQYGGFGNFPR